MKDQIFKGYGRAWTEDKEQGVKRIMQVMREPATTKVYYMVLAVYTVVAVLMRLAGWL